ncbi:receptor-transporting protein 3-like [Betta splendens]|uniref:Receptor-transporting protein 3-like n=1 Tax=Betta splendens TaxID=158456 RepID=A0A6P7MCZ8_BETSP|nr:receptor-transporting protein 3-like [Betta splendens]
MAQEEWTRILQSKMNEHSRGHTWQLEFDDSIEPEFPNPGWKEYIRNTCARFRCSMCRRSWPSNRVMVVFHMRLTNGQGTVRTRRFRQNCKRCTAAPMETPDVAPEDVTSLMEHLVQKIRIKCYNENLGQSNRPFRSIDVNSPHEPSHCEGCIRGVCTRSENSFKFKFY